MNVAAAELEAWKKTFEFVVIAAFETVKFEVPEEAVALPVNPQRILLPLKVGEKVPPMSTGLEGFVD